VKLEPGVKRCTTGSEVQEERTPAIGDDCDDDDDDDNNVNYYIL
jgi:hypothetical protein